MSKFAVNLKYLMSSRGVTAKVISQATGIPQSTLSEWSGGRLPKVSEELVKLAKFFGVTIEYLIVGEKIVNENILVDLVNQIEDGFTTVHQGVYRLKIEKLSPNTNSKKNILLTYVVE